MDSSQDTATDCSVRAAHTPGPWFVERVDYSRGLDVSFEIVTHPEDGRKPVIAGTHMMELRYPQFVKRDEANARLIAAAPELLSVLQEMFCDGPVHVALAGNPIACDALEARARAAIAKASPTNHPGRVEA